MALSAGCEPDAVTLPADYNKVTIKPVRLDSSSPGTSFTAMAGLMGNPQPVVEGDKDLFTALQEAGGPTLFRIPEGYLCDYTLSGIFPNRAADPAVEASYNFAKIDKILQTAGFYPGVAASAGEDFGPVKLSFQALFDIGLDTCSVDGDGIQTGKAIVDVPRWTTVVVNALRHWNKSLLVASDSFYAGAKDFHVRHVEFVSDPLGRGGFTDMGAVVSAYRSFGQAVRAAFPSPAEGSPPPIRLVAPSFSLAAATDAESTIGAFIDALGGDAATLVDVVAFEVVADSPKGAQDIAKAVRAVVDAKLPGTRIWLARLDASAATVPPLPQQSLISETQRRTWSLTHGAFAVGARIALQGIVDELGMWRVDRRYRTITPTSTAIDESPMWRSTGQVLPATVAFKAANRLRGDGQKLLGVVYGDTTVEAGLVDAGTVESDKIWVASTLEADRPCPKDEANVCPLIRVLVANVESGSEARQVEYQVKLTGVNAGTRLVTARRYPVRTTSEDLNAEAPEQVTLSEGVIAYRFPSSVPGVDYVEFELGVSQ
ncbi:MAG: hypothetical protein IV100_18780 [Myxococcales bacterium]|nr:hypothetical protein [Myxococcales bacterium]